MDGILPIWKPAGMTSHDCVFKIRKMLRMKKVGHTGTLDPDVTGVLPICLGKATKISEYMMNTGKSYVGEVVVGFSTTTEDASGEIVEAKRVEEPITKEEVLEVFNQLTGEITQTPPMYSAVKVKGKKLYEYARAGIEVERPSRRVQIKDIQLTSQISFSDGKAIFSFSVDCSKGTYIRTLAVMIGEKLGYPAHMSKLVRTSSGSFLQEDCFTFEELNELIEKGEIDKAVAPLERGISHLPNIEISDKVAEKVRNGAVLEKSSVPIVDLQSVLIHDGNALAIYQPHPSKPEFIKPVKVLRNE
ncbi:tRNA pseudouridine(55) synthase TruB [Falsibacillus albus]|uniref:tRNA pseudouridine synthase B n=1 Tax=Falsibacillus albus TaxID=2478915 RepID=A0A3L7K164_9BACI|nr:tRNA pseudouridine(55) synthase TruB [Falsibacillus albus]RLQ95701.1 tRNA pseudouridine(55) synthase TruB [Falsibacillus albus]